MGLWHPICDIPILSDDKPKEKSAKEMFEKLWYFEKVSSDKNVVKNYVNSSTKNEIKFTYVSEVNNKIIDFENGGCTSLSLQAYKEYVNAINKQI